MPVSHISLTVSQLPQSCSFFLSVLQPLGYRYVGQEGNAIGFGVNEPDFFIVQETPGIPAGAAHIAFPAPSRAAVDQFFHAGLKAGGTFHGEPRLRDSKPEYYSAAITDFDGNSIEAVYKPYASDAASVATPSVVSSTTRTTAPTLSIAPGAARSTAGNKPQDTGSSLTKELFQEACNAVNLAKSVAESTLPAAIIPAAQTQQHVSSSGDSAKTLVGTLIGAAAGAFVAYQMTKSESSSGSPSISPSQHLTPHRTLTYPLAPSTAPDSTPMQVPVRVPLAIEGPKSIVSQPHPYQAYCEPSYSTVVGGDVTYVPASVVGSRASKAKSSLAQWQVPVQAEYQYIPAASIVGSKAPSKTSKAPSMASNHYGVGNNSHTGSERFGHSSSRNPTEAPTLVGAFAPPTEIAFVVPSPIAKSTHSSTSKASESTVRPISRASTIASHTSSKVPSKAPSKSPSAASTRPTPPPAAGIPLPLSEAGSRSAAYEGSLLELGSVAPSDSISQVTSVRSSSHRSKHLNLTHRDGNDDEVTPDDSASVVGSKASTVKPSKSTAHGSSRSRRSRSHSRSRSREEEKEEEEEEEEDGASSRHARKRSGSHSSSKRRSEAKRGGSTVSLPLRSGTGRSHVGSAVKSSGVKSVLEGLGIR